MNKKMYFMIIHIIKNKLTLQREIYQNNKEILI